MDDELGPRASAARSVAVRLSRNRWQAWARLADLLAAEIGDVDEPARVSAEFVAMRLRRLASRPQPPLVDVELPEDPP